MMNAMKTVSSEQEIIHLQQQVCELIMQVKLLTDENGRVEKWQKRPRDEEITWYNGRKREGCWK
jgi:hypothetical protein